MAATEQHAKEQCKRLSSVPVIEPKTAEGRKEIKEALLRHCQSDEHITEVITRFLEGEEDPRNPIAALIRIARNTRRADEPPPGCDRCALGPDVFTGEMRWAAHVARERSDGISFASRCLCERGAWLTEHDILTQTIQRQKKPAAKHEHPADADWQRRAAGDAK